MSVRKIFKTICFFCVTMLLFTTVGTSAWYFFAGLQKDQNASDIGDYLRPNQIFGDGEDTAILDTKYYDVYFLAQNVQDIKAFLNDTGEVMEEGKPNYVFKNTSHDLYYVNNDFGQDVRYGKWDNSTISPYYWKYENINMVTASMLLKMGNPSCQMVDRHGYPLEFNSWICDPYNVYRKENGMGEMDKNGQKYIQVYGSYPFQNFEPAYFNSLLEIYDSRSIYIEGRKSIFFYPIYSTGKGYYAYTVGGAGSDYLRDSISITNTSNGASTSSYFVFDPKNTELMHNIANNAFADAGEAKGSDTTRYYAYRYTEYIVENENVSNNNGFIDNDMDTSHKSWLGTKKRITYNNGTNIVLNDRVGRYNFYLFVKERYITRQDNPISSNDIQNASFTANQEELLFQLCSNTNNIHVYKKYSCDLQQISDPYTTEEDGKWPWSPSITHTHEQWNARDYYLIVEKKYEPRIIGGETGAFDWKNDKSRYLSFVRSGNGSDSYLLHNITFNCADMSFGYNEYTVPTSLRKIKLPDYYFGMQISRDTNLLSHQNIGYDPTLSTSNRYEKPLYRYYDTDGVERADEYLSTELLISIQNAIQDDEAKADAHADLKYKDLDRIMVTKKNASTSPQYYSLSEYREKYRSGEAGFEDYEEIVANLVLVRPIESGTYNFFLHINYVVDPDVNTQDVPESIDLWAYRKHNLFVNIYDPADFGGKELKFDGNYITGNDIKNYSFQCMNYYYLESDLMYEDDGTSKAYKRKDGLSSVSGLTPDASGNYTIYSILAYYDAQGKCLQDVVSGRYITLENYASHPFIVEKNYILQVVPKV